MSWRTLEFDYAAQKYTGNYKDADYCVDSYYGDDTNDGSENAPFKTLDKGISVVNADVRSNLVLAINGVFYQRTLTPKAGTIVTGVGGGKNGRVVFTKVGGTGAIIPSLNTVMWENIETVGFEMSSWGNNFTRTLLNCYLKHIDYGGANMAYGYFYYCIFAFMNFNREYIRPINCIFYKVGNSGAANNVLGSHNHFFGLTGSWTPMTLEHSLVGVDGLYIDPENGNFGLKPNSPLLFAGAVDENTGIRKHIGAGAQNFSFNGTSREFVSIYGATLTNIEIDSNFRIIRTNDLIDGQLDSGLINLGRTWPILKLNIHDIPEFSGTNITKGVFEPLASPRVKLTVRMKYGLTPTEAGDCPWLIMEYGKRPSYSGSGINRKGNGDDSFNTAAESFIAAQYFYVSFKILNI